MRQVGLDLGPILKTEERFDVQSNLDKVYRGWLVSYENASLGVYIATRFRIFFRGSEEQLYCLVLIFGTFVPKVKTGHNLSPVVGRKHTQFSCSIQKLASRAVRADFIVV